MFEASNMFSDIKNLIDFQRKIIDYCADGLMVVDKDGRIVYVNQSFMDVHGLSQLQAVGKHVGDVIDNTRMHIVAQTGMGEHDEVQDILGHNYVVSRIPIIENEECVGVVGIIRFRYTEAVSKLANRVTSLQNKLQDMRRVRAVASDTRFCFEDIVGASPAMKTAKDMAMQTSLTDATVLLQGESGVGKEVFAQSIHNYSHRNEGPFIRLNCSAIQESLMESELFGYVEGAFTGARKGGQRGKFELADGGTIFLDEIGDMPLHAQAKLLRVLQEKEVARVGGERYVKVDVRVIAATNRDLWEMVKQGTFREDLYYRLNVIPIKIPSLRKVPEEIPRLARRIWMNLSRAHGIFHKRLTGDAVVMLQSYEWRGNIRELRNALERAMVVVRQDEITAEIIQQIIMHNDVCHELNETAMAREGFDLNELVEATEKRAISLALAAADGNRSKAAKMMNISRPLLYKKINKYGLAEERPALQLG